MGLFQENPRRAAYPFANRPKSATASIESHNNLAWQEIVLSRNNKREPRHSIVVHFLKNLEVEQLCQKWKKLKCYLQKVGIVALKVAEITRDALKRPRDRIHLHLAIDGDWTEKELRSIFKDCCLASGLEEKDFRIDYRAIYNFTGWVRYVMKYKQPDKIILFVPKTGIKKIEAVGPWYLDEEGRKIFRKEAWEKVKTKQKALKEQQALYSSQFFDEQHNQTEE